MTGKDYIRPVFLHCMSINFTLMCLNVIRGTDQIIGFMFTFYRRLRVSFTNPNSFSKIHVGVRKTHPQPTKV